MCAATDEQKKLAYFVLQRDPTVLLRIAPPNDDDSGDDGDCVA